MPKIQPQVKRVLKALHQEGFEAYLVGGCVRDLLLNKEPKDWDLATSAKPEEIQAVFPDSYYNNKFGTVTVKPPLGLPLQKGEKEEESLPPSKKGEQENVEITTFRKEAEYSDKRHPDKVEFTDSLKEDLSRRDFTINAMALGANKPKLIDPFNGKQDLKAKIIRAVGKPRQRFSEDALRLIRAVRFAVQLNFEIEAKTAQAIKNKAGLVEFVANERLRDEFVKIIKSSLPKKGLIMLKDLGLLSRFLPELKQGVGVEQSRHHIYTVFEHGMRSLQAAADRNHPLSVRLAALLHDIAKPRVKKEKEGQPASFHYHDVVGAKWASRLLSRLRFSKKMIEKVCLLIRHHMFLSDPEKVTDSAARRLIRRVGQENIDDLIKLRVADRIGSGCPKARPYRLRYFEYLLYKVRQDPISVKRLKISGNDVMETLDIKPGPKIGLLLKALLNEVLDDPSKNKKEHLVKRLKQIDQLSRQELKKRAEQVTQKKEEIEQAEKRGFGI